MIKEHKGKKYRVSNGWVDLDLLDENDLKRREVK